MIDLYGMGSPNVVKIFIALEEMGLPYKVIPVDVFGGAQFKAEFTHLNPSAKVPVIVDHDGPGGKPYTVFESGAILIYLAEKSGQFLSKDPVAKYDTLQWLMVQMTGVGPMFGQYVHFMRFAPKGNEYALDRYRTQARRVLDVLEQRLGTTSTRSTATARRRGASSTCWSSGSARRPILAAPPIRSPISRPSPGRAMSARSSARRRKSNIRI
jgi:GST-like protein